MPKRDYSLTQPRTEKQRFYCSQLENKSKKIVIATGSAGTGKTLFATEYGIQKLLDGEYDKLIFTRPTIAVDEELGFLKGSVEEKLNPYLRPILDIIYNFVSPKEVDKMIKNKVIEIVPLGFMRGRTFKSSYIVADEIQNTTISQMKMLLTRIGENSKLVITGDLKQSDRHNGKTMNGLEDFLDKFKGKRSNSITTFEFDNVDIQREPVIKEVLEIYSASVNPFDDVVDTEKH